MIFLAFTAFVAFKTFIAFMSFIGLKFFGNNILARHRYALGTMGLA